MSRERDLTEVWMDWIDKENAGECWLWTGHTNNKGYGVLSYEGQPWLAHRFSWDLYRGHIPWNTFVCHSCDNPLCVNPAHLFLGTAKDNALDKSRKGRSGALKGEECPTAKLTWDMVREIRARYVKGGKGCGCAALAWEYHVTGPAIWAIVNKRTWRE